MGSNQLSPIDRNLGPWRTDGKLRYEHLLAHIVHGEWFQSGELYCCGSESESGDALLYGVRPWNQVTYIVEPGAFVLVRCEDTEFGRLVDGTPHDDEGIDLLAALVDRHSDEVRDVFGAIHPTAIDGDTMTGDDVSRHLT